MTFEPHLRPDFRIVQRHRGDLRSPERLTAHYLFERQLATRLRGAPAETRPRVYGDIYNELYSGLYDHPHRTKARATHLQSTGQLAALLTQFANVTSTFLEIGCGDSELCIAMAAKVRNAIGVDVQDLLISRFSLPSNYTFIRSPDGIAIPLPDDSVDCALSNQLLEHLHPDDARAHMREILRVLKPGGVYFCITPNSLSGPHDISMYFDFQATGLHINECGYTELIALFKGSGFREVRIIVRLRGLRLSAPKFLMVSMETVLRSLSPLLRARIARIRLVERLMGINLVGYK